MYTAVYTLLMGMSVGREFETRHPFIFVNVCCFHFCVFLFFFNYTHMEVVSPVGMFVYTAVYTLAADVAFLYIQTKELMLF